MEIPTLLRMAEHRALGTLTLEGSILDLGGGGNADYRALIGGDHVFTTVDLGQKADITHDLEEPLPMADEAYDHVLLINVLEHVFNYKQLLSEARRVVRPEGKIIIVVPFLFPIHPSPKDFWRFSAEALTRECEASGLTVRKLTPLGTGVFSAQYVMIDRLMPGLVRVVGYYLSRPFVQFSDALFTSLARRLGKKYDPADYALGYYVVARRR